MGLLPVQSGGDTGLVGTVGFGSAALVSAVGSDVPVIILSEKRLVFLEMPKAASTSVASMLKRGFPDEVIVRDRVDRHIGINGFQRKMAEPLALALGGRLSTFAVVREPVDRALSWYRYRQREKVGGQSVNTTGIGFDIFLEDCLKHPPPAHARIGSQVQFVAWAGGRAKVDYLFDFANLRRLKFFLSTRTEAKLTLPKRNISPEIETVAVPADLMARLKDVWSEEFALYETVRAAGMLRRAT